MASKLLTYEDAMARWGNQRFGSYQTGNVEKRGRLWFVEVKCDCGCEHVLASNAIINHKECKCRSIINAHRHRGLLNPFKELESIWPKVVKAGQRAMRKHNAMASI